MTYIQQFSCVVVVDCVLNSGAVLRLSSIAKNTEDGKVMCTNDEPFVSPSLAKQSDVFVVVSDCHFIILSFNFNCLENLVFGRA